jgi:S1-C subfamily serine protease
LAQIGLVVVAMIVSAVTAFSVARSSLAPQAATKAAPAIAADDPYPGLFRALQPSVVFFQMEIPTDDAKRKGEWDDAYGSGFVIASDAKGADVLTDDHVIAQARNIRAVVADNGKSVPITILARDGDKDLALVRVAIPNAKPVVLGRSADVVPGQAVGILGYPIPDAYLDEKLKVAVSFVTGRVSAIRSDSLEITAPVIPGESGGPVIDIAGRVVGLAESRFDEEHALGFATPIDTALAFLKAHGHGVGGLPDTRSSPIGAASNSPSAAAVSSQGTADGGPG